MTTTIEQYLADGCMRCKYGATPQCKVNRWRGEIVALRQLALSTGLVETIKWGVPVYTHNGKNILTIGALKESANIGFFKGSLLSDSYNILQQVGKSQASRIIKFTDIKDIQPLEEIIRAYIFEAIEIEKSGIKVIADKKPEPLPTELITAFASDPAFEYAFHRLTPGRQRGYIIHFSQPKQSKTREKRIAEHKTNILNGIGLNDKYNCPRHNNSVIIRE